jgi:hypothetical protein
MNPVTGITFEFMIDLNMNASLKKSDLKLFLRNAKWNIIPERNDPSEIRKNK